jgi:NifU-like protein involved in Fe-S cluster formation
MWKYSKELMDHFMNPRNAGQMENPDGHSEVGSPQCGDAMTLDIQVDDNDVITGVMFQTFGCAGAIASASALTEMAKGRSLGEARKIRNSEVAAYLGGMPPEKYHCSVMGHDAMTEAIDDFESRRDEVEKSFRKILRTPPKEIAAALAARTVEPLHFHPVRITVKVSPDDGGSLVTLLAAALRTDLGRDVKVAQA